MLPKCDHMFKNKPKIAPESIYNPRASRALKRALDPGRKGLRASRSRCALRAHEFGVSSFKALQAGESPDQKVLGVGVSVSQVSENSENKWRTSIS